MIELKIKHVVGGYLILEDYDEYGQIFRYKVDIEDVVKILRLGVLENKKGKENV